MVSPAGFWLFCPTSSLIPELIRASVREDRAHVDKMWVIWLWNYYVRPIIVRIKVIRH